MSSDKFKRHILLDLGNSNHFLEFRDRYDNTGIYCTVFRYDNPIQAQANLYGNMYLDFDSDSDEVGYEQVKADAMKAIAFFTAIFGVEREDIQIFFSGKKGIHLMIPAKVMGVEPSKELNDIFKLIAKDIHSMTDYKTVDLRIYDRVRLFRVTNSIHPDTGLHKIPLTYEDLSTLTYSEVQGRAQKPRKKIAQSDALNERAARVYKTYIGQWEKEKAAKKYSDKQGKKKLDFCPPCIKHMLREGAEQGKRNNTIAALASYFKQRGHSEQEAMDRLLKWNDDKCSPPVKEAEIKITLQSIYRGDYIYGCSTLKEISVCDEANCKLAKKK